MAELWITEKIHASLKQAAGEKQVYMEGLGNILLLLSLSDPQKISQAVSIIKTMGIGGGQDLQNKLG
jgi:hypothetical protein